MKKLSSKKLIVSILAVIVLGVIYISSNGLFAKKVEKEIVIPEGAGANSVVSMLKEEGLILVDKKGYITLTETGEARAKKIYERHEMLTEFFVSIGVSEETASADACKIEHVISDETFEAIKRHANIE